MSNSVCQHIRIFIQCVISFWTKPLCIHFLAIWLMTASPAYFNTVSCKHLLYLLHTVLIHNIIINGCSAAVVHVLWWTLNIHWCARRCVVLKSGTIQKNNFYDQYQSVPLYSLSDVIELKKEAKHVFKEKKTEEQETNREKERVKYQKHLQNGKWKEAGGENEKKPRDKWKRERGR